MFLVGLFILIIGLLKRNKKNDVTKTGLIVAGIPAGLTFLFFFFQLFVEIFTAKPNEKELVGVYHISEVRNLDFDKSTFNNYKLQLNNDKSFYLSPTPFIEVCDSGQFEVTYHFMEDNRLWFDCSDRHKGFFGVTQIDRHFGSYRIEFIIGDPDSRKSIYYEKIKK